MPDDKAAAASGWMRLGDMTDRDVDRMVWASQIRDLLDGRETGAGEDVSGEEDADD